MSDYKENPHSDDPAEELSTEAVELVREVEDAAFAPEPPQWWWLMWVAAFLIVSLGASLTTEAIKGWGGIKETRAWRKNKSRFSRIGLLFPLLAFFGGIGGFALFTRFPAIYRDGPLIKDAVLAFAVGTIAPVFAVPLWELGNFMIGLVRRVLGKRAGLDTAVIDALEEEARDGVCPLEAERLALAATGGPATDEIVPLSGNEGEDEGSA